MSQNPFFFGEVVGDEHFVDRYKEREFLVAELSAGKNVLITGPRYYGKSSLARKVLSELERQGRMTVYLDLERAYSPTRLIELYLAELLRAGFRQAKELRSFIESLDEGLRQRLCLKLENTDELTLDLPSGEGLETMANAVLELAQHAVEYKKRPAVVCLDEVESGGNLPKSLRRMFFESARQQGAVGYLLVSTGAPLDPMPEGVSHLNLEKVEARYLQAYIKTRFENTGYRLSDESLAEILELTDGHPHYAQMLCHALWNQWTGGKLLASKNISQALDTVLDTQGVHYAALWRDLSLHQKNLLLAVSRGGGEKIFSQDFVGRFGLGSFSTVQKSLSRLLTKEVLERRGSNYAIRDIFLQRWLQRRIL